MKFNTLIEAEEYFKDNFTQSDDVDKEEARMERWLEDQEIEELCPNDPQHVDCTHKE